MFPDTHKEATPKEPVRSDSPQGPPSPKLADGPTTVDTSTTVDSPTVDPNAIHPERLRFMKKHDEAGPKDLAPLHIGRHPIPWSMPNEEDLRMIFVPELVEWIQSSDYHGHAANRCFCSLVLHILSKRLPDDVIHNDPIDRDDFRGRLGELFSDDGMPLDHLLDHCANGYNIQKVRKVHKRPMTHNT
ncbi:hypothetical protein J4E85_000507 [Alternaria conjuncta]|uniref:uncharacterized protein n=1 Tax=Alternaria conjuncta TaxID=181017 RepID=UPI00221F9F96|nr:uncharacterized protein J4E85_000507 [Alternaria conjuncta]KAI4938068.1 hypothetical protein J4E85_000507 [Alternaria conjuncta]